jgi:diadenylate cyclase
VAEIKDLIPMISISEILDIAFMFLIIYSVLVWFKRTRAAFVVTGMLITGAAYLLARQLELPLTTSVFQGFFAIIIVASVVIFQEEIKHFFEQVASWSALRRLKTRRPLEIQRSEIETLVRTLAALAQERIGALVVIRGRDPILRHVEAGEELDGSMSEPLLRSIFDPHSIGHDGAVIIEEGKVQRFSCHLPLSKNLDKIRGSGTRHAAALGLSELTDALCLVVSEERGSISVAQDGKIHELKSMDELTRILETFYADVYPTNIRTPLRDFFRRNYREKAIALFATFVLWFLFVQGAKIEYESYRIPVHYSNVPSNLKVQDVKPADVEAVFSGSQRSFYFLNADQIRLNVKLFDAHIGVQQKSLSRVNLTFPDGLTLENIDPKVVAIRLTEQNDTTHGGQ